MRTGIVRFLSMWIPRRSYTEMNETLIIITTPIRFDPLTCGDGIVQISSDVGRKFEQSLKEKKGVSSQIPRKRNMPSENG